MPRVAATAMSSGSVRSTFFIGCSSYCRAMPRQAGGSSSGDLVIWSGNSVTALGVKGSVGGINDFNVVVGAAGPAGATHAFIYSNGKLATLGPADAVGEATAINLRGQVAGTIAGH